MLPGRTFVHRGQPPATLLNSLFLSEKQCAAIFPGLTRSVDNVVEEGPFKVVDGGNLGPVQGRIKDGKVILDSV